MDHCAPQTGRPLPAAASSTVDAPHSGKGSGWWKVNGAILAEWVAIGAVAAAAGVSVTVGVVFSWAVLAMSLLIVAQTGVLVLWIFPAFLSYEFENAPSFRAAYSQFRLPIERT